MEATGVPGHPDGWCIHHCLFSDIGGPGADIDKSPRWEKAPLPTMTVTGGRGDPSVVRLGLNLRF